MIAPPASSISANSVTSAGPTTALRRHGVVHAAVLGHEGADAALHGHVQTDGGLVQEQHLRPVQERHRDLALHPLARGQIAHRPLQQRLQIEQAGELVQGLPVLRRRHPVDTRLRSNAADTLQQLVAPP